MKYYKTTTEYNCGIDLHSKQMYVCLMDKDADIKVWCNIKGNDFDFFLRRGEPYRHDLTVTCESTFNGYWLADACMDAGIEFVLGQHNRDRLRDALVDQHDNEQWKLGGVFVFTHWGLMGVRFSTFQTVLRIAFDLLQFHCLPSE